MRCYVHSEEKAVGACVKCGKFVCEACNVEVDGKTICKNCIQEQTRTDRRQRRKERKYGRDMRAGNRHDERMSNPEFEEGESKEVASRFSLFLLTFFTPTGFNYLALGLKRRASIFLAISLTVGFSLIMPFIITGGPPVGETIVMTFISNTIILMSYPFVKLIIFRDVLRIRSRMAKGMEIDDSARDLAKFFKSSRHVFMIAIFALVFINVSGVIGIMNGGLDSVLSVISFPFFIMLLLSIPYLLFRSLRGINGVLSKKDISSPAFESRFSKKETSREVVEVKENQEPKSELVIKGEALARRFNEKSNTLYHTSIGNQVREIADITYKMISYIEKEPEKARVLNKFIDYYMPTTLELLDNYEILKKQNLPGKNIEESSRKIERTMDNMVLAFRKQADMLFEEKALNIDAEISVLDDLLKREGLL